jgi:hypothetical protein
MSLQVKAAVSDGKASNSEVRVDSERIDERFDCESPDGV